jgi:MFS transporter, DHA1 family, tetracycline resistance protein
LSSISSLMGVIAPLLGNFLLALVGHLSPSDWRVGLPFFLAALLQLAALIFAARHFRRPSRAAVVSVPEPSQ